jgi:hypothetical protein
MKKSVLSLIGLLCATSAFAQDVGQLRSKAAPCITNITVICKNGARFWCNELSLIESFDSATGMVVFAQSCDLGPVMTFTLPGCPSSDTDVATVSWSCNEAVNCGGTEGGPGKCAKGDSFTITIPACTGLMSVRIYSALGCCSLTKCIAYPGFNCCGFEP